MTLSLSGLTANKNFDVFCYSNSGTPTLESLIWTDDSNRATALVLQDGIYVKSGATTRRYLGSFRTTGTTGQTEVSGFLFTPAANGTESKVFVWNAQNRVPFGTGCSDNTDSWTHPNNSTWAASNGSNTMRVSFLVGLAGDLFTARYGQRIGNGASTAGYCGIGVSSTSVNKSIPGYVSVGQISVAAHWQGNPALGFSYLQALTNSAGGTSTFYGDEGGTLLKNGLLVSGMF